MNALTQEPDWDSISFEASQLFTPARPLNEADLFAGREREIRRMIEALFESGKHIVLFGESGVGKTSLAKLFSSLFPATIRHIRQFREQADPYDDFNTVWKKVFKDIEIDVIRNGRETKDNLATFYDDDITPDDVRRELERCFVASEIPIIIIDEYDKISSGQCHELMANTIKSLSDYAVNATIILVGVADNVNDLIGGHQSIPRSIEQVLIPRMSSLESKAILDKIIPRLGMSVDLSAARKIVTLARGLPSYVHSLGLYAAQAALERKSLEITDKDIDPAIHRAVEKSEESIQERYFVATYSNRSDSLYKQVLLACALAPPDERGTFTPLSVCKPLTMILGRDKEVEISAFQQHLKKFVTDERGDVLMRRGRERAFRFRFTDPIMQPYVIMRGLEENLISRDFIEVLSREAGPMLTIGF